MTNRESRVFQAKWPGICEICDCSYEAGDDLHFVYLDRDKLCGHATCHAAEFYSNERDRRPRSSLILKGKRTHEKHCGDCGLEHAGEC